MPRTRKLRAVLAIVLLSTVWLAAPAPVQAEYCGEYPTFSSPPTDGECSYAFNWCMCDCGSLGVCYHACSNWVRSYGCPY